MCAFSSSCGRRGVSTWRTITERPETLVTTRFGLNPSWSITLRMTSAGSWVPMRACA